VADILNDPQYKARSFWQPIDHPETGPQPYAAAPFQMSKTPARPQRAPLLGEHNQEIYGTRLGLSRQEMDQLKSAGII
jgi:crotonobetainyl-CoA:carnitine CoA-transferase CaiB-like acyl-CoA transferase